MKTKRVIKYISLFAGIGGFELGIQQSDLNAECVFASEIDKYATITYQTNFPNHKLHGDITKIPAEEIPTHDLLVGGFPCQAFSVAGKRKGFKDPRGTMFYEILRIIDYHETPTLVLENVRGLLNHDGGKTFATIKNELENRGYTVYHQLLNAKDYGVPQNRQRVFLVCLKNGEYEFPDSNNKKTKVADILESDVDNKYFLSKKGVDGLKKGKIPTPESEATGTLCAKFMTNHPQTYLDLRTYEFPEPIPLDKCVRDILEPKVDAKYFLSEKALKGLKEHKARHEAKGNGFGYSVVDLDKCCGTITTKHFRERNLIPTHYWYDKSDPKNGGQGQKAYSADGLGTTVSQNGRHYYSLKQTAYIKSNSQGNRVYDEEGLACTQATSNGGLYDTSTGIRRLTPREAARLQGFPDDFQLLCSDTQSYKQLGNSICVPVVKAIMDKLAGLK